MLLHPVRGGKRATAVTVQIVEFMEKPIVFLSHSSLDKAALAALKKILDDRAAGSLNFFLSSDGESIRFGRNWVVRISDALSQAKLMFVFLSPQSADSKWIHFEAGCAYAKDIQVVPVCLPGIDLNRITPPLSLLQGFNLHSQDTMGNLARICNETFNMKINETFRSEDFDKIVSNTMGNAADFFGSQTWAIDSIQLNLVADVPSENFNPIPALHEICKKAGMNCRSATKENTPEQILAHLEQPGCLIKFVNIEVKERRNVPGSVVLQWVGTGRRQYSVKCTLSPELFQINARMLDQWRELVRFAEPFSLAIELKSQIIAEKQGQSFTAKLYQVGIKLAVNGDYEFDGLSFKFGNLIPWTLHFELGGKLEDDRFPRLLERLFRSMAFFEREPNFGKMFEGV